MTEEERVSTTGPEAGEDEPLEATAPKRAEKAGKASRVSKKLQSTFALPQASSKILSDILKAYVIASNQGADAVMYKDVAVVANLHPTQVSRNNAFLGQSGFIVSERYGYYRPAPEVTDFAKEAPWDESGSRRHLRQLIDRTWYGEVVLQKFQMRSAVTKEELVRAFGIKATPDPSEGNRLDLLLDFLEYVDYIEKDEQGNYVPSQQEAEEAGGDAEPVRVGQVETVMADASPGEVPPGADPQATVSNRRTIPHVNINVTLSAATTEDELKEIASKVRSFLEMLRQEEHAVFAAGADAGLGSLRSPEGTVRDGKAGKE